MSISVCLSVVCVHFYQLQTRNIINCALHYSLSAKVLFFFFKVKQISSPHHANFLTLPSRVLHVKNLITLFMIIFVLISLDRRTYVLNDKKPKKRKQFLFISNLERVLLSAACILKRHAWHLRWTLQVWFVSKATDTALCCLCVCVYKLFSIHVISSF